ncbi:sulfur carrier protein ThiS [Clostridium folliculivorans]|uniref:Thiamine biosynthesis protein ThiS n=1 Tax=Clostridium folliculivorans TaxID=2886038 RepID=A0A9W5XY87_9CLOT|nr:sulfur carrier protein ThiS [Clostridium folliculivorans]GKU23259.1 thiamine biosynthesis protein ThiS [Clostridium folliculivorans]GKU29376.1 thiamine biosynthesis protein ThiS [Clostridium folliculivorans]
MILNGEKKEFKATITVAELLDELKINSDKVVVEVDRVILDKNEYAVKKLSSESEVELIRFVGGG